MKSLYVVISAPVDTYSGYGGRSRDVIKALLKQYPSWDIQILSQRWGDTRQGYLEDHNEYELLSHITYSVASQPDIWIQITVPNEFQPVGKFNIGMTAAIETNLCDLSWIEGCNRMDLIITSSEHGKKSLVETIYTDNRTGRVMKVEKPVEVLFEGIDLSKFHKLTGIKNSILKEVKNPWNFLCVGHWMQGNFGEDRKNIAYTIKVFLETFKDKDPAPGLILKISQGITSIYDREELLNRIYAIQESVNYIKSLPDIYLLHGDLTDTEINELYNDPKVKCLVSFTKGEGYGRPLAEFATTGKPILCSGWSGQLDFLNKDYTMLVGGTLEKVHSSAVIPHMILAEASWFRPNDDHVISGLKDAYAHWTVWKTKAEKQRAFINSNFNLDKMQEKLSMIFQNYLPEFPEEMELNLPELDQFIAN